jgi:hypothetical protein
VAPLPTISRVSAPPAIARVGAPPTISRVTAPPHAERGVAPASERPTAPRPGAGAASLPAQPDARELPLGGPVDRVTPAQLQVLVERIAAMGGQDYFEMLGLSQSATSDDVKRAFHRESRAFHPDRFFHLGDAEAKRIVGRLYKNVTEAYSVLRDPARRQKYTADINGPSRGQRLRYTEESEAEQRAAAARAADEEFGTHPKARPFFKAALADIAGQRWRAAELNLKTALAYEPENQRFKDELERVRKSGDREAAASPAPFQIR